MLLKNLSVDCVIFGFDSHRLKVLLWQADRELLISSLKQETDYEQVRELFESHPTLIADQVWGLIGGHVPDDVSLDQFAQSLTTGCTGLKNVYLKQFHTFGDTSRVPYYRVVTIGYYALINPHYQKIKQSKLTKRMQWFDIAELPELCFDHKELIHSALVHLRESVRYHPVGFHLLPARFTLTELQNMYEAILGKKLDIRNFRKKMLKMELLQKTSFKQENVAHRAARYYSFDEKNYLRLVNEGLQFRIT